MPRIDDSPFVSFIAVLISLFPFNRVENIVGKGENAGKQHFLLSPQCFQKTSSFRASKLLLHNSVLNRMASKVVIVLDRVKDGNMVIFYRNQNGGCDASPGVPHQEDTSDAITLKTYVCQLSRAAEV